MQLKDLVKPIDQMTDEELQERLREIRHNRTVARPAARKRVEREERKTSRSKVTKAKTGLLALLEAMSEEEKAVFLKQLEGTDNGATGE